MVKTMIKTKVRICDYCNTEITADQRRAEIKTKDPGSEHHNKVHDICVNCMKKKGVKDL